MADERPRVIVLAGPNGAGKTTASRSLLADTLGVMTYVNADAIALGIAAFDPDSAAIEAGRIMLERLHALAAERADFAFETTLASRSLIRWFGELRDSGYRIDLVYFWLASADLAVARVAQRIRDGGHAVPVATIRRRYRRSVENLLHAYRPIVNSWLVYETTNHGQYRLVARGGETIGEDILLPDVWQLNVTESTQ